jgi:hypothetical protein
MIANSTESRKVHGHGHFQPKSVRVVDYDTANNNVLVRGSSAFGAKGFTMDQLIAAIKVDPNFKSIKGIKLAAKPMVIDFCLIGFVPGHKDARIVKAELGWFNPSAIMPSGGGGPYPNYFQSVDQGNPGVMVYWPIRSLAGGSAPTAAGGTWSTTPKPSIGNSGTDFNFMGLIPAIRNALTNKVVNLPDTPAPFPSSVTSITNAIIYVHCDSGVNRTGAAVASYLMDHGTNVAQMGLPRQQAGPYTLAAAQAAANKAPPGDDSIPPGGADIPVAEAYCNYQATGDFDAALNAACVPDPTN